MCFIENLNCDSNNSEFGQSNEKTEMHLSVPTSSSVLQPVKACRSIAHTHWVKSSARSLTDWNTLQ